MEMASQHGRWRNHHVRFGKLPSQSKISSRQSAIPAAQLRPQSLAQMKKIRAFQKASIWWRRELRTAA
jgi:hypothetical protein